jgi:hypothetical protein
MMQHTNPRATIDLEQDSQQALLSLWAFFLNILLETGLYRALSSDG